MTGRGGALIHSGTV